MEIDELRNDINVIDKNLTKLFIKRMELISEIAKIKKNNNFNIKNAKRENEIINIETSIMPDEIKSFGVEFYKTLFKLSRDYQKNIINN